MVRWDHGCVRNQGNRQVLRRTSAITGVCRSLYTHSMPMRNDDVAFLALGGQILREFTRKVAHTSSADSSPAGSSECSKLCSLRTFVLGKYRVNTVVKVTAELAAHRCKIVLRLTFPIPCNTIPVEIRACRVRVHTILDQKYIRPHRSIMLYGLPAATRSTQHASSISHQDWHGANQAAGVRFTHLR